jgi:hypothetical protein
VLLGLAHICMYLREFVLQGMNPPKNECCTVKLRFVKEGEKT